MKKLLVIASFLILAPSVLGQQQFVFTNYLLNHYYYNPALAGSQDVHIANLGYRNQWVGFEDSPVTIHGNFYGSFKNQMKHGYGASVVSDRSGLVQNTNIHLNYAYHVNFTDSLRLGFGLRPGWVQNSVKLYDAILADAGDDILEGNTLSYNAIDLGSGLYLYHPKFFVTIGMRHMIGKVFSFTTWNYGLAKHFTFAGGYNFVNKKRTLEVQPSILFQYVKPAPLQLNAMVKVTHKGKYWYGLTMRTQDAVGVVAGIKLFSRWNIGYAFDYSIGNVRPYNGGTHELMISFVTTKKKPDLDKQDEDINNGIFDENKKDKE